MGRLEVVTYNGAPVFCTSSRGVAIGYVRQRIAKEFPDAMALPYEERGRTTTFERTPFVIHAETQFAG